MSYYELYSERRNNMFNKRVLLSALVIILTMAIITGCGFGKKTANQVLQDALLKTSEMKSAAIDGVIELDLDLSSEVLSSLGPEEQMILETIKNAKITYKGSYQVDPMQYEIIVSADIPFSGMKMQFDIPILITADKMWIKIPSLPVPGMDQLADKFIEFDFEQLAELSGDPAFSYGVNSEVYAKFSQEVIPVFFKHFEESYFNKVDVKTLTLANNATAKDAVELKITQDNLKPFIKIAIEKVMPEMFDIMAKDEYQKLFNLNAEMIAEAKKELTVSSADLDEMLTEIEKTISNLTISTIFAIDKNGFMPQQTVSISGTANIPELSGAINFNLKVIANSSKINETLTFENSFPPSNIIPFEELMYMGMDLVGDPYADNGFGYEGDPADDLEDEFWDANLELIALYEEMALQEWFTKNSEVIDLLIMTNYDFISDFSDPEILRLLIDDADFRAKFFASYEIELKE